MPFAGNFDQDEKNRQQSNQGSSISGTSTTFATNVPGQTAQAQTKPQQKESGSYANIQEYLDANRDQAGQMGQKVAQDVGQKAEAAQNKIQEFAGQAPKVEALDPNKYLGNVNNLTDAQKTEYKTAKQTGGYTGPDSIDKVQGYGEANKLGNEAIANTKMTATGPGQQTLLRQMYNRPQYSAGENKLDQALIQQSDISKQALEAVNQKYSGLQSLLDTSNTNVGNAINAAVAQAQVNKAAFAPAEDQAVKALIDPINARIEPSTQNTQALNDRLYNELSASQLTADDMSRLGLNAGTRLYNLNLSNYFTPNQTQLNANLVATPEERVKYQALMGLLDRDATQIQAEDPHYSPYFFNKDQFVKDQAAANKAFNDFAAQAVAKGDSGWVSDKNTVGNIRGTASLSLADYLAGKEATLGFEGIRSGPVDEVQAQARQQVYQQLNDWLNQYGYNNTIRQG